MRTLSHYFTTRYLIFFAAILVASTVAITIVEVLVNYDEILRVDLGLSGVLTYVFLRIPSYYLRDLIPIAAFAASFSSLAVAARWLETTAVQAGGISPPRLLLPLLLAAAALAAATYLVNESLVTQATRGWNEQQRSEDDRLVFRRGAFWYHKAGSIYNIASADPETSTLRGVEIFRRSPRGRLIQNVWADEVTVRPDGSWRIERATVRHFDPEHPDRGTRVELDVSLDLDVGKDRDVLLRQADAASLSLPALAEYLSSGDRGEHPGSRANRERLRTLLHRRIAEPLTVLLFSLLAMPAALRVGAGVGLGEAALRAVATVAAFFALRGLADTLAHEGLVPGPLAVWSLLGAFALWGGVGLARAAR